LVRAAGHLGGLGGFQHLLPLLLAPALVVMLVVVVMVM
jgi:hypothetical protein